MLRRLLYREWILNRQNVALMFGIYAAYQIFVLTSIDNTRPFVVMAALFAAFLTTALFVREDKFRATWWVCTLPVTRLELIRARYVAAWWMVVAALAGSTLLAAVVPGSEVLVTEIFDPWTLLIAATATTLIFAWVLPFTIRFGMFGLIVFLIGAQLLGAGVLVVGRMLPARMGGGGRPIRSVFAAIGDTVAGAHDALGSGVFAVGVVVSLLFVNWLSYRFAVYMFRRQEF